MGMELHGRDTGAWKITGRHWRFVLAVARAYGWYPHGTDLTPRSFDHTYEKFLSDNGRRARENWGGSYHALLWQRVSECDANEMAEALGRAIEGGACFRTDPEFEELLVEFGPPCCTLTPDRRAGLWRVLELITGFCCDNPSGFLIGPDSPPAKSRDVSGQRDSLSLLAPYG